MKSMGSRKIPEWIVHASTAVAVGLMLVAAGQPIFTDDTWFHLALGRAHAASGPWLAEDPLLFTAAGPPTPSAWLFQLGLYGISGSLGFLGLRLLHVACVGAILALAWSLLRRASGSAWIASLGTLALSLLAAYRLVQLRPHLASMLFALLLYWACLEGRGPLSRSRLALGAALLVVWANTHAAFLLGPLMLLSGGAGLLCALPLRPGELRADDRRRGVELLVLGLVGLLVTTLNPGFLEPHFAWFVAGDATPDLGLVLDEWLPLNPLALPSASLPPSLLSWALYWSMLLAGSAAGVATIRAWRAGAERALGAASPLLLALALGTLFAPLFAVRFLWLTFFTLLLAAASLRSIVSLADHRARLLRWVGAGAAVALLAAYPRLGAWPMISHGVSFAGRSYCQPYPASKYYAHTVWFLADAGLRGNLFNEYSLGGFLGYWLAPELRSFVNGSLNLTPEAMDAYSRIRAREGGSGEEGFAELLVEQDIDVFLASGLPALAPPGRPQLSTVGHLEGMRDWLLVFRNPTSAVYLPRGSRGAANLEAIAEYYAARGVPFDRSEGFEAGRVIEEAPRWAVAHGLAPRGLGVLQKTAMGRDRSQRRAALEALAAFHAALGSYGQAADLERRVLRMHPEAFSSRRRLVWSLLRAGRFEESQEEAALLVDSHDALARTIAAAALEIPGFGAEERAARIALLPVFTRAEAGVLRSMLAGPRTRESPDRSGAPGK